MFLFACGFFAGMLVLRSWQLLFSLIGAVKIWKFVEIASIRTLAENEQWRSQALTILKLSYEEANKLDEFDKVKAVIDEKHQKIQAFILKNIKRNLPYRTEYTTVPEAVETCHTEILEMLNKERKND